MTDPATTDPDEQRSQQAWSRRGRLALLLLLLLALALRLWYLQTNPLLPQFSNADDGDYYQRALRLATTGRYIDDIWLIRPPLHVFIFAALLRLGLSIEGPGSGVLLIQLLHVLLGLLQVALAADLARRLWRSERAGLVLGAALALFWPLVEMPALLFSEQIYLLLWTLHLWLLQRFEVGARRTLVLAGLVLGLAALTRSPALYALVFVTPWLWLLARAQGAGAWLASSRTIRQLALLAIAALIVVLPWTLRNYIVYQRFIPVDTLGPINLWLDLGDPAERNIKIETLRRLPQADRQAYASAQADAILSADPDPLLRNTLFRNAWPNFQHIWKAQFVEDFVVKRSFYGRPLRAVAPLGLLSDLIWLALLAGAAIGIWLPALSWRWRVLLLAWLSYTLLTVLVFHVEPRYLTPIWLAAGWLAAGVWAAPRAALRELRARPLRGAGALLLLTALLGLLVSYRDYPALLRRMWAREQAWSRAEVAFQRGEYQRAVEHFQQALAAAPRHEDVTMGLALVLAAQNRLDESWAVMQGMGSRRAVAVQAYLLLRRGEREAGVELWNDVLPIASEDINGWLQQVLPPVPRQQLTLGQGDEMGAISGFGAAEVSEGRPFRWSSEGARVLLQLEQPVRPGAELELELGAVPGRPGEGVPVQLRLNGQPLQVVVPDGWRRYRLLLPAELVGAQQLQLQIDAPVFVPQQRDPQSIDRRALGVMVSTIRVEQQP